MNRPRWLGLSLKGWHRCSWGCPSGGAPQGACAGDAVTQGRCSWCSRWWHPGLRLVPMAGRCPWHVLGDTVVATGRLGCRARPLRCPRGGQGVVVPYLRWLRRWQQPRCGRAWPTSLAWGHPEDTRTRWSWHPWWSREPWGGTLSGITCWGRVTASAAAVLLHPKPPVPGTWGTPTVATAGSQRGGAGTLGTPPLGASPRQPTARTKDTVLHGVGTVAPAPSSRGTPPLGTRAGPRPPRGDTARVQHPWVPLQGGRSGIRSVGDVPGRR